MDPRIRFFPLGRISSVAIIIATRHHGTVTTRTVVSVTCLSYHMGHCHCEISSVANKIIRSNKVLSVPDQWFQTHACVPTQASCHCRISSVAIIIATRHHGTVTTRSVVSDACLCSHPGIVSLSHQQCSDHYRYEAPWYCHYEISSFRYVPVLPHGTFPLRDQQCSDRN
jgi:hypothetical protein